MGDVVLVYDDLGCCRRHRDEGGIIYHQIIGWQSPACFTFLSADIGASPNRMRVARML
jgi:hypothetical protein